MASSAGKARAAAWALALLAATVAGCLGPAPGAPILPPLDAAEAAEPLPAGAAEFLAAARLGLPPPLQALLDDAARAHGVPVVRVAPPAASPADLVPALLELAAQASRPLGPADVASLQRLGALPPGLAGALAQLARAAVEADRLAREAYAEPGEVDWALALRAQRVKLAAVEAALPVLRASPLPSTMGGAEVCGVVLPDLAGEARTHTCEAYLLVDLGGDDVYRNSAGGTFQMETSVLALDLAGDDLYERRTRSHEGATGGAFRGLGMLVDAAGDDSYNVTGGEGVGLNGGGNALGLGFLADLGGSDRLVARADLHAALNGGSWGGSGALVLRDGPDWVEAEGLTGTGANGGAVVGAAMLVASGGDRTYLARLPSEHGGAANGGSFRGGQALLVDDGGATRYEAWVGNTSAANGGSNGGRASLYDLGGGDDTYFARAPNPAAALNGEGEGRDRGMGTGMLQDRGGTDTYDDQEGVPPRQDHTIAPKGRTGAQLDRDSSPAPAGVPRGADALPPAPGFPSAALAAAVAAGWTPRSLHELGAALAGQPGAATAARPGGLAAEAAALAVEHGQHLTASELASLAALPADLQRALAGLLAAYRWADGATRSAAEGDTAPLLAARGALLAAVEAARPALLRHAGQRLAPTPLDLCPALRLDLTSAGGTSTCNYFFQLSLGGDTTYHSRAGGNLMAGTAAFLLDAAGDDRYLGPDDGATRFTASTGGAYVGLGMLVDLAGDDLYAPACSPRGCVATGGALGGVGTLLDQAGDDVYRVGRTDVEEGQPILANGGATVGLGLLADLDGRDEYHALGGDNAGLNGGATFKATALLVDREGSDLYHAEGGVHSAMNGGSLDGGALLLDLEGDDTYWALTGHHGTANGGGFASSPGAMLLDAKGDDRYTGLTRAHQHDGEESVLLVNGRYYMPGTCGRPRGCHKGWSGLIDLQGADEYLEWFVEAGSAPPEESGNAHDHGAAAPGQANQTLPDPRHDETQFPKGDGGAQLDLETPLAAALRRLAAR